MSFAQNSTTLSKFEEEILSNISETRAHLDDLKSSMWQALYHLQKLREHDSVINELTNIFNSQNESADNSNSQVAHA